MRAFPQLSSGALVQFPFRRQHQTRFVENRMADGRRRRWRDARGGMVRWELSYRELTLAEKNALEALFAECKGRMLPFVFADPGKNLFGWSEAPANAAWEKAGGTSVTSGLADPLGGTGAFLLTAGGAEGGAWQTQALPGDWQYCVSGWIRNGGARAGLANSRGIVEGHGEWKRFAVTCGAGSGEAVSAGVWVEAGGSAELFGLQWEAQPGPSSYQRTEGAAGIYPETYFAGDELRFEQEGPDNYSIVIALESRLME